MNKEEGVSLVDQKLAELQKELDQFDRTHYPGNNTIRMTLGIVEECGELWEAIQDTNVNEIKNALADIIVFSMQLASFEGIDWVGNFNVVKPNKRGLGANAGRLCHHVLKRDQGLGKSEDHLAAIKEALANIGWECARLAELQRVEWKSNFIATVEGEVLKRNRKEREQKYIDSKGK
jgi:NTP pyrophosphatase (non-canonical NTP hydrolase)